MSSGAFSIDQLMELAGLSVSQAGTLVLHRIHSVKLTIQSSNYNPSAKASASSSHVVLVTTAVMD